MVLDEDDKNYILKDFEVGLSHIPSMVKMARDEHVKKKFMINNDFDFVIGNFIGKLERSFAFYYIQKYGGKPSFEDLKEGTDLIYDKIPDIRNAILEMG